VPSCPNFLLRWKNLLHDKTEKDKTILLLELADQDGNNLDPAGTILELGIGDDEDGE
jgi:hypothetical protein